MDRQTRSFRTSVVTRLARRIGLEFAVVLTVIVGVAGVRGWMNTAGDLALALVATQLLLAVRVVTAVETNPLNRRFLSTYADRDLEFAPLADAGDPAPAVEALMARGLRRVGAIGAKGGGPGLEYDVLQAPSRLVTAAVARQAGSVEYLTKLSDRRILHTSNLLVPPRSSTVVNPCPGAPPGEMLAAHLLAVQRLEAKAIHPVASSPSVFVEALREERNAFRDLGAVLGSLVDLTWRRVGLRLQVSVPPQEIIDVATAAAPAAAAS